MWENLKKDVKKMVDKKHELETQYRTQRDMHIEELAMTASYLIKADIIKALGIFDENCCRIYTCGSVHVDNTFNDVSFGNHLGMIEDKIRRNVPDWVTITEVSPWDSYTNVKLRVRYIINEAKVCEE